MATQQYPTYETLQDSGTMFGSTLDFCRIRWCLQGSIAASISVLQDPLRPNAPFPLEPYQREDHTHPISALPLTAPPCSSIEISLPILDDYALQWRHVHGHHAWPDDPDVRYERRESKSIDDDDDDDDNDPGTLVHCCGQNVPGPGPSLLVEAADSAQFLTIGRFISVVHPWISALEGEIRAAKGVWEAMPLEERFHLFVRPLQVKMVGIMDDRDGYLAGDWQSIGRTVEKFWPRWVAGDAVRRLRIGG